MPTDRDYDPITGQVFRQWNVPVPDVMSSSWNRIGNAKNFPGQLYLVPKRPRGPGPRGPAPLVDMCLRAALLHIDEMEKANLQGLPARLVGRIWEDLKHSRVPSVENWKLIVTGLAGVEEATQHYCYFLMRYLTSIQKIQPLEAYIEPLVSNTFDFLAHLTITGNITGNTPELLQLVELKNLAVLEFIQPDEEDRLASLRLTDSILREWSRTPDPFPVLRVLRVWANDHVTGHSLRYVNAFPSLVLYDIAGKKRDWATKSEEPGWKFEKKIWAKGLDYALWEHFRLLHDEISDDRWEVPEESSGHLFKLLSNLSRWQLTVFPREEYEAYCKIYESSDWFFYIPRRNLINDSLWGFLIYSHIGRLISDRDLLAQGLQLPEKVFAYKKDIILPPRPMLHLVLTGDDYDPAWQWKYGIYGDRSSLERGSFETQLTFVRKDYHLPKKRASGSMTAAGSESAKRAHVPSPTHRRPKRRWDISNMLESFDNA
ncbi:hypothetical protein F4680DRAFT_311167 [Xylaria scruposa]|nr:hypothetical protein F4680DRAFT_311167 [Xylaria scruposa]